MADVRRTITIGAVGVVALLGGATMVRVSQHAGGATAASPSPAVATAEITRTTLVQTASVDGTLSYGPARPVKSKAAGTLTWLPSPGVTVKRGAALLRADEQPVVLFYGELPSYRPLVPDTTGTDVKQFESNLRALGYTGFTVDQHFTASTSAAVKRWQRDLHRPTTGTVASDAVIYLPGPVRIADWVAQPGDSATGEILTCTGTMKVVTAQVNAQNASWAKKGAAVDVVPPVGGPLDGKVADVGTELSVQSGGDDAGLGGSGGGTAPASLTVTITIADQHALRGIDRAPVNVLHVLERRVNVLTAPVTALVAPVESGYAVEIVDGSHTRLVPVKTGLFADGRVEISGTGLDAGMKVRVPA